MEGVAYWLQTKNLRGLQLLIELVTWITDAQARTAFIASRHFRRWPSVNDDGLSRARCLEKSILFQFQLRHTYRRGRPMWYLATKYLACNQAVTSASEGDSACVRGALGSNCNIGGNLSRHCSSCLISSSSTGSVG